jgi:hypothetical protein
MYRSRAMLPFMVSAGPSPKALNQAREPGPASPPASPPEGRSPKRNQKPAAIVYGKKLDGDPDVVLDETSIGLDRASRCDGITAAAGRIAYAAAVGAIRFVAG